MKLTPQVLQVFLDELRRVPFISYAAGRIGVTRRSMTDYRENNPAFAELWDAAVTEGIEAMEVEAHRRAFRGNDKPLTHQGCITYERDYSQPRDLVTGKFPLKLDANNNPIPVTIKEYSDSLTALLLKAHAPAKYRENLDVTVRDGDLAQRLIEARKRAG